MNMLILASASPRRHELLLAAEKANAAPFALEDVVLAADTVVSLGNEILGKSRE